MHIGILSQWYDPEPGPARVPGIVARGLRDLGHDITVVTGFPNYPTGVLYDGYRQRMRHIEKVDGIQVVRVPLWPSHGRSALGRATNYVSFAVSASVLGIYRQRHIDALWVYNSPATIGLPAILLAKALRKPTLLHVQDLWPDSVIESGLLRGSRAPRVVATVLGAWCNLTYKSVTEIAVVAPGLIPILESRGVAADKLHFIPNSADEALFNAAKTDTASVRSSELDGKLVLMYAGSLGDVQSLDTAVRAAARLADLDNFVLALVGSGVAEASLRELADNLGAENVLFLGRRTPEEMPQLLRQADAQLVSLKDTPLLRATMPSKIQAILASGQPMIVAANGDAATMVEQAGAGLTCAAGDDEALANAIRELASMSARERRELGERGRSYYHSNLSSARIAAAIETLISRMVTGPRA